MSYKFKNKTVWITGASSGIGLALAKEMLAHGANVAVSARNKEQLDSIYCQYNNALVMAGDLTCLDTNRLIVERIVQKFGTLDCVILNAGGAEYIDISNFSYLPFKRMMDTNFLSMVKGIEASLPFLRQSSAPYLVGMSSSVAWQGLPKGQSYSASKAAILNLFQGIKIELASEKIDVSWICPGFVKTPLTDKNTFAMPGIVTVEKAGEIIYNKLCRQTTEIHFPKRFTYLLKAISMLPASWATKILKNTVSQA